MKRSLKKKIRRSKKKKGIDSKTCKQATHRPKGTPSLRMKVTHRHADPKHKHEEDNEEERRRRRRRRRKKEEEEEEEEGEEEEEEVEEEEEGEEEEGEEEEEEEEEEKEEEEKEEEEEEEKEEKEEEEGRKKGYLVLRANLPLGVMKRMEGGLYGYSCGNFNLPW